MLSIGSIREPIALPTSMTEGILMSKNHTLSFIVITHFFLINGSSMDSATVFRFRTMMNHEPRKTVAAWTTSLATKSPTQLLIS